MSSTLGELMTGSKQTCRFIVFSSQNTKHTRIAMWFQKSISVQLTYEREPRCGKHDPSQVLRVRIRSIVMTEKYAGR